MDFRRIHRDERRRRVLMEETDMAAEPASEATEREGTRGAEPARRYTEAALSPEQPRVLDLIPTRRWTNLVLVLLMLSGVAAIQALYGYVALGYTRLQLSELPAINLGGRGSMATWFSSSLLAASAVYGLLIYQIRRHRADDYRGRYRMWCWIVPLLLLGSLDQVAGVQQTVRSALLHVAGIADYPDAQLLWVGLLALLTSVVGGRLIVEMRACRLAVLMVLCSLAGLAAVGCMQLDWLLATESVFRTMVRAMLTLGAHVALLMSIFLYGRHVHLDAQGQLLAKPSVRRKRSRKTARRSSPDEDAQGQKASRATRTRRRGGRVTRTDPPHASPDAAAGGSEDRPRRSAGGNSKRSGPKAKRRVAAQAEPEPTAVGRSSDAAGSAPCEPDDDQVDQPPRKLSKAERKRLRKQRRREQQS